MTVWWNCACCDEVTDEFECPKGQILCPECRKLDYLQVKDILGLDLEAGMGLTKTNVISWDAENKEITESLKEIFIDDVSYIYKGIYWPTNFEIKFLIK